MWDKETQSFNNLISALNDLGKGQKEMMDLMGNIENKGTSTEKDPANDEGFNSAECRHASTTMQSHFHSFSKFEGVYMFFFHTQCN